MKRAGRGAEGRRPTFRQQDRQRDRRGGLSVKESETRWSQLELLMFMLTLEHLRAHLLIMQQYINSHARWQRQERRCLVNCGARCPDFYFIACSTCLLMTLSATGCLHGNYTACCATHCSKAWKYYLPTEEEIQQ